MTGDLVVVVVVVVVDGVKTRVCAMQGNRESDQ
jgi:hypothetical protein